VLTGEEERPFAVHTVARFAHEYFGIDPDTVTELPGEVDFNYTDGTAVGAVAASNGDLQILQGTGKEYPFGTSFTPRVWNGTIYYGAGSQPTFSICNVSNVSTTGFQCNCVDLSGAPVDTEYHFITTEN